MTTSQNQPGAGTARLTVTQREAIAEAAHRLSIHAYCDEHPDRLQSRSCPFCKDIAAYRRLVRSFPWAAIDTTIREGRAIPLSEIRAYFDAEEARHG